METPDSEYERAKQHVEEIRGFYIHISVYVVVISGLFAINALTRGTGGNWWAYWPAIGWGIGLGIHAVTMLTQEYWLGRDWEQRKIRQYMDRERPA